jgi:hypothetical protein
MGLLGSLRLDRTAGNSCRSSAVDGLLHRLPESAVDHADHGHRPQADRGRRALGQGDGRACQDREVFGRAVQLGVAFVSFSFAALISINLAFINLLPIPTLDGGHLAIYAAEAVRRRPLGVIAVRNGRSAPAWPSCWRWHAVRHPQRHGLVASLRATRPQRLPRKSASRRSDSLDPQCGHRAEGGACICDGAGCPALG